MPVYAGDKADLVKEALLSIYNNSLKPDQIVVVEDGPISQDIEETINYFRDNSLDIIRLPKNLGIVNALNEGIESCRYQLIARCDADDINLPDRFALQINEFYQDPDLDMCGGHIIEIDGVNRYKRLVPTSYLKLNKTIKIRNPFNHMTVMYKKDSVLNAGKYIDIRYREDYALWAKMHSLGYKIKNIDCALVHASGGIEMFERRGKFSDIKFEVKLQKYLISLNIINIFEFCRNMVLRVLNMVISPKIRGIMYVNFLRKKA